MAAYSERHPVPTVQEYRMVEAERERAAEANESSLPKTEADEDAPRVPSKDAKEPGTADVAGDDTDPKPSGGGQEEKERLMAQMAPKDKPAAGFHAKGER